MPRTHSPHRCSRNNHFSSVFNAASAVVETLEPRRLLAAATLEINDVSLLEGNDGLSTAHFTVTLRNVADQHPDISVRYSTASASAKSGRDFQPAAGLLSFPSGGTTTQSIDVPVIGDTINEINERFRVLLSFPKSARIIDRVGIGTIINDDATPAISANNPQVLEGDSGLSLMRFNVRLSNPSSRPVTMHYATVPTTATARSDYLTRAGILTFAPGRTSKDVLIPIRGDTSEETVESFFLALSRPINGTVALSGQGTIIDDEGAPKLYVTDAAVQEGNSSSASMNFVVGLSRPSNTPVTVHYSTTEVTALDENDGGDKIDYLSASGDLTFNPGDPLTQTVTVQVQGDTLIEGDETLFLDLSSATGADLALDRATGTIIDDDSAQGLVIDDPHVVETEGGTFVDFSVTLPLALERPLTLHWETADGTAIAGADYDAGDDELVFDPGVTSQTISIHVLDDSTVEADETFKVILSNADNAPIAKATGTCTIQDNERPTLYVGADEATVMEGSRGHTPAAFVAYLLEPVDFDVTFKYRAVDGELGQSDLATTGVDYSAASGVATIPAGQTSVTVNVPVYGDTHVEPDERFFLDVYQPVHADLDGVDDAGHSYYPGNILNDDVHGRDLIISALDYEPQEGQSYPPGTLPITLTLHNQGDQWTAATNAAFVLGHDGATQPSDIVSYLQVINDATGKPLQISAMAPGETRTYHLTASFTDLAVSHDFYVIGAIIGSGDDNTDNNTLFSEMTIEVNPTT